MGFWGSLFGGSSPEQNALIKQYGQIGTQATGEGMSDINAGSGFWKSILSGDSSKQMQALAPEINAAKKSASQDNKTSAMFGTRSGGTAAGNAARTDALHGYIANLLGNLTGKAADSLTSTGGNLLSTGLGALGQEQEAVQQRMQAWSDSILGRGITTAVAAGESYALGGGGSFGGGGSSG
jgi:hypothetical protein